MLVWPGVIRGEMPGGPERPVSVAWQDPDRVLHAHRNVRDPVPVEVGDDSRVGAIERRLTSARLERPVAVPLQYGQLDLGPPGRRPVGGRHHEIALAVAVQVADRDGLRARRRRVRDTRPERAVAVPEEDAHRRGGLVRHRDVELSVAVEVREDRPARRRAGGVRLRGLERAVAVPEPHGDVPTHRIREDDVRLAIAVEVSDRDERVGRGPRVDDRRAEGAVAVPRENREAGARRDEQVRLAVPVHVRHGDGRVGADARAPAREGAHDEGSAPAQEHGHGVVAVHGHDVRSAVPVQVGDGERRDPVPSGRVGDHRAEGPVAPSARHVQQQPTVRVVVAAPDQVEDAVTVEVRRCEGRPVHVAHDDGAERGQAGAGHRDACASMTG